MQKPGPMILYGLKIQSQKCQQVQSVKMISSALHSKERCLKWDFGFVRNVLFTLNKYSKILWHVKVIHALLIRFREWTDFVCSVEKEQFLLLMERVVREQQNVLEKSFKVEMVDVIHAGQELYHQRMEWDVWMRAKFKPHLKLPRIQWMISHAQIDKRRSLAAVNGYVNNALTTRRVICKCNATVKAAQVIKFWWFLDHAWHVDMVHHHHQMESDVSLYKSNNLIYAREINSLILMVCATIVWPEPLLHQMEDLVCGSRDTIFSKIQNLKHTWVKKKLLNSIQMLKQPFWIPDYLS